MENYMGDRVVIGGYTIDGIEMLLKDTCCLYFEEFKDGGLVVGIVVEKWLDDGTWHFMDNYFEENGDFLYSEETTHLSEGEKEECKKFIDEWLELLDE